MDSRVENLTACEKCKGICCCSSGCEISLDDLKDFNKEILVKILQTGIVSIDWWEGDPRCDYRGNELLDWKEDVPEDVIEEIKDIPLGVSECYFLRIKDKNGKTIDPAWGGECLLHSISAKCLIPLEHRPLAASTIVPKDENHPRCISSKRYTKKVISLQYLKFHSIFQEIYFEIGVNYPYKDNSVEELLKYLK